MSSNTDLLEPLLISDSSALINFLRIDRMDLITSLPYTTCVTDIVRAEIMHRYRNGKLEEAIAQSKVYVIELQTLQDLQLMESFIRLGLGLGEAASIAAAVRLNAVLAIDDTTAIKKALFRYPGLSVLTTSDLIVLNIRSGVLSINAANIIKNEWDTNFRFKPGLSSFADALH